MNVIYVCKVSGFQAAGNQIDIPKKVGTDFFNVPLDNIEKSKNTGINICHISDVRSFEIIEIQPATNLRWSTKLNKFLSEKGERLNEGDLLIFEKLGRSYCVRTISNGDEKYDALIEFFDEDEKHLLLSSSIELQPKEKDEIKPDLLPYLTAIRTKPFLLLAGISGTGKSRIVRKLAQATNDIDFEADYDGEDRWKKHSPTNFCLIQVKPNWHNSMDVVGFKSNIGGAHYEFTPFIEFIAKAWHYPDTPFFLCLDEMNLAPVEEYFAEFLSAIESRSFNKDGEYETDPIVNPFDSFGPEVCGQMIRLLVISELDTDCKLEKQFRTKGLTLPKNLIVMGTVNMDETTFSFSRKVLDRAMSIEMNEVNYDAFLTGETEEDVPLLTDCNMLLVERPINAQVVNHDIDGEKIIAYLKSVNALLDGTPFKLGYRAANEAFLYVSAAKMFGSDDLGSALDKFTVMKILSRIEGDDSKLKTKSGDDLLPALLDLLSNQFGEDGKSISMQKLTEMNDILMRDHFVSFWG